MSSNKNYSIKRSELVDDNGKLTKLGMIVLIVVTTECLKIACKNFNELIEDDKKNE